MVVLNVAVQSSIYSPFSPLVRCSQRDRLSSRSLSEAVTELKDDVRSPAAAGFLCTEPATTPDAALSLCAEPPTALSLCAEPPTALSICADPPTALSICAELPTASDAALSRCTDPPTDLSLCTEPATTPAAAAAALSRGWSLLRPLGTPRRGERLPGVLAWAPAAWLLRSSCTDANEGCQCLLGFILPVLAAAEVRG